MAVYTGYRFVLPGQNTSNFVHNTKGTAGTYSNWAKQSSVHLLDEAPLTDVEPGKGAFPGAPRKSQQFTGEFSYNYMELEKYVHEHDVSYLISDPKLFQGLDSAAAFPAGFGHDGTREFNYSRFRQLGGLGLTDPLDNPGHPFRAYGEGFANMGPVQPYIYQGVTTAATDDPGETLESKQGTSYGFEQVRIHQGVPSSKAL